jgi:hypothetical protein
MQGQLEDAHERAYRDLHTVHSYGLVFVSRRRKVSHEPTEMNERVGERDRSWRFLWSLLEKVWSHYWQVEGECGDGASVEGRQE